MAKKVKVEGKIATVISMYEIAINKGRKHGVKKGDGVQVWHTIKVIDPDTSEVLGHVRLPRITVEVTLVDESFCVASTFVPRRELTGFTLESIFGPAEPRKRFKADELDEGDDIEVTVGDPVTITVTVAEGVDLHRADGGRDVKGESAENGGPESD